MIDLTSAKVGNFLKNMQPEFYVDSNAVTQAVQLRSSFNAIHFATVQKVDSFIRKQSDYAVEQMRRSFAVAVDEAANDTIIVASPEDVILQKLVWYAMGSRISERQWNDVLGVIKVQGQRLDRDYLMRWAEKLSVADLVEEALRAAQ